MRIPSLTRIAAAGALATCLGLSGCSDTSSPGIQPQIANLTDDFSYQVSNVSRFTGSASYTWSNTGISANVNQATAVTAGTMTLIVTDANGAQVYARSLSDNGTFVTTDGVAGSWTIRITYHAASGTVNFRVQKKT